MSLLWIIALVILLYARTWNYNYMIDDNVKRNGYLYEVPEVAPNPEIHERRPSVWYRVFMIGMHCVNVSIIHMLWGWAPALLFAVHPIGVWCTAWVTGNYYATTAYFVLIIHYILSVFPNVWGAAISVPLYIAALNSTINALSYPFVFLFTGSPWGLVLLIPLARFLTGKRFKVGVQIRKNFNPNPRVNIKFTPRRLVFMTKVVARYIHTAMYPDKLGLFGPFGNRIKDDQHVYDYLHSFNAEFWTSLTLVVSTAVLGCVVNWEATVWFFVLVGLHSQFVLLGQVYAQRYLYLPLVGLCVIFGTVLQHYPIILTAVVTFYVIRTHLFIPVWRYQEYLWRNDLVNWPGFAQTYNNLASWFLNKGATSTELSEAAFLMSKSISMDNKSHEIHMNMACLCVQLNQIEKGLHHTERAIECLEPLRGGRRMLEQLYAQRERLINRVDKGGLPLSHPDKGGSDDKSKEETNTESIESVGDRHDSGRKEGVGSCVAGV